MKPQPITRAEFLAAYEEYADALHRHLRLRINDREQVIDLLQETFLKAWTYVADGKEVKHVKALLFTIAHNLIVDTYRSKMTISLDMLRENEEGFDVEDEKEQRLVIAKSEVREVIGSIERLPPLYRDVVMMRYVEGFQPAEIAEIMKLSENVISVRLNRGVRKIRKDLKN